MLPILVIFALCIQSGLSSTPIITVRVATVHLEPFYRPDGKGFIDDLIKALAQKIGHMDYSFYTAPDGQYGSKAADGSWDGLIGEVVNGTATLAAAAITVTKERREVVEFSYPFMSVFLVPLIKRPPQGSPLPFANMTQYLAKVQSGEKSLGYLRGGSTAKYIAGHTSPFIRQFVSTDLTDSQQEGVAKIRSTNGKYAYYGESAALEYVSYKPPCDVMIDWHGMIGRRNYALAFPKTTTGRYLMEKFNDALMELEQDGTLGTMTHKWWRQQTQGQCERPNICICDE